MRAVCGMTVTATGGGVVQAAPEEKAEGGMPLRGPACKWAGRVPDSVRGDPRRPACIPMVGSRLKKHLRSGNGGEIFEKGLEIGP